ncbi:unnamed protein product [Discula destructiva]
MSSMLRKKEVFTIITPIPGFIPRQLAIDILHSHSEVITLNPLVLDHRPIKAPRNAASDEFYSTWYEIEQRIQYIPGIGKMGSGKITFTGCFHDMPWGLQTHIYAPMNVDLKNRYRISGNQPGFEPPETQEIGLSSLGAPSDGLYLRDDIEIKCNYAVASFVKSQLKAASKDMVARIIKKAELLDAGVLHAMIENGKLKTINPNDRTNNMSPNGSMSGQPSPTFSNRLGAASPTPSAAQPYQIPRPLSCQKFNRNGSVSQNAHWSAPYGSIQGQSLQQGNKFALPAHAELSDSGPPPVAPIEMPGDYSFPQHSPRLAPPQPSPSYHSDQESTHSSYVSPPPLQQGGGGGGGGGGQWRWSQQSQQSDVSGISGGAMHSPNLSTHNEDPESDNGRFLNAPQRGDSAGVRRPQYSTPPPGGKPYHAYNPADYAEARRGQQLRSQRSYGYSQ